MQQKLILYWLPALIGFILLSGCAAGTAQSNQQEGPPQKLLLFQKTPCYGTCPAYNATIFTDGSVFYEGFRYAPVQDTLHLQLSDEQLQNLKASLQELDYAALESSYRSPYTDLPSTYLTFFESDKEVKRVRHQQDGPPKLQQLIQEVHALITRLVMEKTQVQK